MLVCICLRSSLSNIVCFNIDVKAQIRRHLCSLHPVCCLRFVSDWTQPLDILSADSECICYHLSNKGAWATQPLEQILDSEFLPCELGVQGADIHVCVYVYIYIYRLLRSWRSRPPSPCRRARQSGWRWAPRRRLVSLAYSKKYGFFNASVISSNVTVNHGFAQMLDMIYVLAVWYYCSNLVL